MGGLRAIICRVTHSLLPIEHDFPDIAGPEHTTRQTGERFTSLMWHWKLRALVTLIVALTWSSATLSVAKAQSNDFKAVVELFTSQGCSSCPPADALLESYVSRPDVLALTFPVDYWDYLGWKDTYASPRFSERQRAYAKTRGDGSVYTPQAVINGRSHAVGSRKKMIDKSIMAMDRLSPLSVPVSFRVEDKMMLIDLGASKDGTATSATVWVAIIQKVGKVNVRRGENGGRTLSYYNIVRELTPVGMWTGEKETIRLDLASMTWPKSDACAVLVQQGIGGPIIGAAWMGMEG